MQQQWERKQVRQAVTRNLLFTAEQSKRLQVETQTRIGLHTASLRDPPMGVERLVSEVFPNQLKAKKLLVGAVGIEIESIFHKS